ncbi:hypothetical protein, conserved [Eimeria tenella]|uniref:Folate receptor-like domain-containing protein n=1 Tax=Eimeria tenella TaxID=5802 RepID=U6KVH5_EIMTE|nr:hypothetical protein, conserved [Eimeria tenella]CDJ39500.1 hypothetical protein, conserved [Eimeria tenella]|eukprot:XP_013230255.1 hypothetical protein, conserved [Eimeria tenella]
MLLVVLLPLALVVSIGAAFSDRAVCLRRLSFDGQPPQDQREYSFQSCKNHAANTCCYPQHTELIKRRLGALEDNKECKKVSEEVMCVLCEPRFGTGELESKGNPVLCPQLCEKWFAACKEAFVSASPSGSSSALTFCDDNCLICSRLSATLDNSLSFCHGMGYEVLLEDASDSSEGVKQRRRACYGGVPTASFSAAPKLSERQGGYGSHRSEREAFENWLWGNWYTVYELFSRPEVWLLLLVFGFLLNQLLQQAREIVAVHEQEEKLERRQQILERYSAREDEEEEESVSSAEEADNDTEPAPQRPE